MPAIDFTPVSEPAKAIQFTPVDEIQFTPVEQPVAERNSPASGPASSPYLPAPNQFPRSPHRPPSQLDLERQDAVRAIEEKARAPLTTGEASAVALGTGLSELATAAVQPKNLAIAAGLTALTAFPPTAPIGIGLTAGLGAKQLGESAGTASAALEAGNIPGAVEQIPNVIASGLMVGGGLASAAKSLIGIAPKTATALDDTISTAQAKGGEIFNAKEKGNQEEGLLTPAEPTAPVSTDSGAASTPPSADIGATIIPGAKEFIEQDVIPKAQEAGELIRSVADDAKQLIGPASVADEAKATAGMIRQGAAELAQKDIQARSKFNDALKSFDATPPDQNIQFIDNMERGVAQATPELTAISKQLRETFDQRVEDVRALGTDKLREVIENYFPHIWKKPDDALPWYLSMLSRRPLRGSGNFLKQRTFDYTTEGMAAGLEPVSTNPIELTLIKLHEIDKYVMGQKIINEMKDKGLLEFSKSDIPPDGYAKIDDRLGNVIEYRPTTKADGTPGPSERIIRGHWYAPEDAARVLNNYLSPGLQKYAWYRALHWFGNTLNQAQLGLSGFHLQFTMIDTATSKLSLGVEELAKGDFTKGTKNVSKGVAGLPIANQLSAYLEGSKVLREYTKPGSVGGDYAQIVDGLLKGGGRVAMPEFYKNNTLENFFKAIRTGNYPGAMLRAPFATIEAVSYPLMQQIVPRLKLGVFSDMARAKLAELGPTATKETLRTEMGKIWDEVDNRLGQMVYDNLFWNRTLKDLLMVGVRAVGWNYGTIRALGGGVKDFAPWEIAQRVRDGEPVVTRKMAYVVSLPITVGLMGAAYQYLHTGKGPEELKDYFMPKTGKTNADGTPERVIFPSYLKDAYAYAMHPLKTIGHKVNPQIAMVTDMLNNKDFFGTKIVQPDDTFMKGVLREVEFVAKQFVPFSVTTAQRRVGKDAETKVESFLGIIKPPVELTRTKAMNEMMRYVADQRPEGGRTQEQKDLADLKREIADAASQGENVKSKIKEVAADKKLSTKQEQNLGKSLKEDMRLRLFRTMPVDQAVKIFRLGDAEEQSLWKTTLNQKLVNAIQSNPRKAAEYRAIRTNEVNKVEAKRKLNTFSIRK